MQRKNVRMLQIRRRLYLGQKPLGADHGGKLWPQHLYRHPAIVFDILREVNGRHSARANLPLYPIAISERGSKPRKGFSHAVKLSPYPSTSQQNQNDARLLAVCR